jgi:CheY-like chemotaxis protein
MASGSSLSSKSRGHGRPTALVRDSAAPPKRILIVDDEPLIADLLTEMLTQADQGYAVQATFTASDALAVLDRERPDVILLDVNKPGMNGLEALRRIKRHDPTIPILMVTAAHYSAATEALVHGALAYIPKPFTSQYINHLVASALGTRPSRR